MAAMTIRRASLEDAPEIVSLTSPISLATVATAASFRRLLERPAPGTTERLVAVEDGAIVAWAPSGLHGDGSGWFWIGVDRGRRRRGTGSALYDRVEDRLRRLDAGLLRTVVDDEDGRRFVERRGFERSNVQRLQALNLPSARLPRPPDALPLGALEPWSLFDLYRQAYDDIPARGPRRTITEEDYRREVVESTTLDAELSTVILEAGEPVAFTLVSANREAGRGSTEMTAVRADRRGRGLGLAVKAASLHRARAAGLRTMLTSNDLENAPMLAVNRRLGFQPSVLIEHFAKGLGAPG
jgi:GNAT superfamily N-acetyltransferase